MKYDEFEWLINAVPCKENQENKNNHNESTGILNYEKIRPKIFYRIISAKGNEDLLNRCPHIPFFDMAITYRWLFHESDAGITSALIEKKHLEIWGVEEQEIAEAAVANTEKMFPLQKKKILEMIQGWIEIGGPDLPLYVVTNCIGINGASVLFYKNALYCIGEELGQDFYILPSSIHEVLVIGKAEVSSAADLYEMVWEANRTVVSEQEFLSNQVFYYDREKQEIKLAPK